MPLRVYNSLTATKEPFEPVTLGRVGMYLCGPTVYKAPHIGHMVGPLIFDAVKRYLTFKGFQVKWVVNITDVDDKLINAAAKQGVPMKQLAEKHQRDYERVLESLGIRESIDSMPKATDHMSHIIAMCESLIARGHAYASEGSVYFDVASDADYGKLTHQKVESIGGSDDDARGKRGTKDFALWKAEKPGEPSWPSPWGKGRPGWHIECSAMSVAELGDTFDIHGGGMDLKFPHHENELAQAECATGKTFVKYWLHNGLTRVKTKNARGEDVVDDMHESTGNAIRVEPLLATHGADVVRYLILSTHYRSPIEFSELAIDNARKAVDKFRRLFEDAARGGATGGVVKVGDAFAKTVATHREKFVAMMDDDFNTGGAVAVLHELLGEMNSSLARKELDASTLAAAANELKLLANILGLFTSASSAAVANDGLADGLMNLIIKLRADARAKKDFATADAIRNGLTELKIVVEDRAGETIWRKI